MHLQLFASWPLFLRPCWNPNQGILQGCKFGCVKLASAMKMNSWICSPATDFDLESGKRTGVRTRKMVNCV